MTGSVRALAIACLASLAGCLGSGGVEAFSAKDSCYDVWTSVCTRYYQCYSPADIAEVGLPPTVEGCGQQLGNQNCAGWGGDSCANGLVFHPAAVAACRTEIESLACEAIADAPDTAPMCAAVCTAN